MFTHSWIYFLTNNEMIRPQRYSALKEALLPLTVHEPPHEYPLTCLDKFCFYIHVSHEPPLACFDKFLISIGTAWIFLHTATVYMHGVEYIFSPPQERAITPLFKAGSLATNMALLAVGYIPILLFVVCRRQHARMYCHAILIVVFSTFFGTTVLWLVLHCIAHMITWSMEPMSTYVYAYLDLFSHK